MGGIDCDRREQRVQLFLAVIVHEPSSLGIQLVQAQNANPMLGQSGAQCIPALVLVIDELVTGTRKNVALLGERQTIGASLVVAVLDLLHHRRYPNLEELIQIAGRDSQKLQTLQKRIPVILGFFKHTPVEREPRGVAVEIIRRVFQRKTSHLRGLYGFIRAIFCCRQDRFTTI